MSSASSISTRTGLYVVLQVAPLGRSIENLGILLVDPQTDHCMVRLRRDLEQIAPDDIDILELLEDDLASKGSEMGGTRLLEWLEEHASHFLRATDREEAMVEDYDRAIARLYKRHVQPNVLPFRTHLPVFTLAAAAGRWGEHMEAEPEGWIEAPRGLRLDEDLFVAHVVGHSMERRIPAGSLCLFRGGEALAGTRQGRLVLVENYGETGENRYTIKRYRSIKGPNEEGVDEHKAIILEPLNPEYEAWELTRDSPIRVIGEFIRVLED